VPKLIGRSTFLSPAITQSLDCNIQANLVAVLETVGDGLGGIVDFDRACRFGQIVAAYSSVFSIQLTS